MTDEENLSLPEEDDLFEEASTGHPDGLTGINDIPEDADAPYLDPIDARQTVRHRAVGNTRTGYRPYTAAPSYAPQDDEAEPARERRRPSVAQQRGRRRASDAGRDATPRPPHTARRLRAKGETDDAKERTYTGRLTPKLMLQLAAPHTWPAAVIPVLFSICLCIADTSAITISAALLLLLICVLMQSAANTINDYFDFVKGADARENQDDPTDAVLVYNDINPTSARNLALAFIGAAFLLGIPLIVRAGWFPVLIACIGAVILFLYSGSRTPISYLPIGEIVSGITMGGLIPLASYQVLTLDLNWMVLLYSIPLMIGIALIMFTNNTCDIEKDDKAARKTLSVMLGRESAVTLYRNLLIVWMIAIALFIIFRYPSGWYGLPFMILCYGPMKGMFHNPFTAQTRGIGMAQIGSANAILGVIYCLCLLLSAAAYATL